MGSFCPLIFKKLKGKHKIMLGLMDNYLVALQAKYASKVTVKWVWAVCALISVIAVIGYAAYCTSRSGNFTGGIKLGVPDVIHVTFNCTK